MIGRTRPASKAAITFSGTFGEDGRSGHDTGIDNAQPLAAEAALAACVPQSRLDRRQRGLAGLTIRLQFVAMRLPRGEQLFPLRDTPVHILQLLAHFRQPHAGVRVFAAQLGRVRSILLRALSDIGDLQLHALRLLLHTTAQFAILLHRGLQRLHRLAGDRMRPRRLCGFQLRANVAFLVRKPAHQILIAFEKPSTG